MLRLAVQLSISRLIVVSIFVAGFMGQQQVATAGDLVFRRIVLNAETDYSAACVMDVNHDGKLDVVCGGDWYENPNWNKHFVANIPKFQGRPDGFSHLAFDVNRDSWTDVITVNWRSRSIKWMEHPGASLGPWTLHTVVEPGSMETGRLVDVDGDGQLDLLPNCSGFAAWWEMKWADKDSKGAPEWVRHELPPEAGGHGIGFGDVDRDGRGDIIGQHGWLKAPADPRKGRWIWNPEFELERASVPLIVADVDDDNDSDIVWGSAHGFGVYWLEQTASASGQREWTRHTIDSTWSQAHSPLWVDFDRDGRNELIAGKRYMAHGGADPGEYDPLAVYRYQFDPATRAWNRYTMSPFGDRVGLGLDPKAEDIDGDGDLDLIASGRSGVYILENVGSGDSSKLWPTVPTYSDHKNLLVFRDSKDQEKKVEEPEQWGIRRSHILASVQSFAGKLPGPERRVPVNIQVDDDSTVDGLTHRRINYQVDAGRRVKAEMFVPTGLTAGTTVGILCMFESADWEAGKQIATEIAKRGYVCLVPEIAANNPQNSTTVIMDRVWQAMRGIDVLQSTLEVNCERIATIGDASGGQLGAYVAAIDERVVATVADASQAKSNDFAQAGESGDGFSTAELFSAIAPRSIRIQMPQGAQQATELQSSANDAAKVFAFRLVESNLHLADANGNSSLLAGDRKPAIDWLDAKLRRSSGFRGIAPPRAGGAINKSERANE